MLIGNTPLIKIYYEYEGKTNYLYTKLEYYNLTGSIKDRVALYMIKNAIKRKELKENMPIIEATSGNTGISLSALGKKYGHKVYIFMPDWASKERIAIMKNYGAEVILISRKDGGFKKCLQEAEKLSKQINGFWTNQFSNKDNILAHYETTGTEILEKLQNTENEISGFVSGVGTGGTLMGISQKLKEKYKNMKTIAIEPEKMPIISGGEIIGQHKIEGIGDDFVPELLDKNKIDNIYLINDDDAINMAKKLSEELGLGVGISSGANFIGCVIEGKNSTSPLATVFADDNKKYLSTDLGKIIERNQKIIENSSKIKNSKYIEKENNQEFISNKVKLLKYEEII